MIESALAMDGYSHGLHSLEVRTSPDDGSNVRSWYNAVSNAQTAFPEAEIGVVFHLQKERELKNPARSEENNPANPDHNPSGFRYGWAFNTQYRGASALAAVLRSAPRTLKAIRGVDICGDETSIPTWAIAPLIKMIQEAGNEASRNLGNFPPLRTTIHAGEDSVYPLDGLRRIDEAVRHLGLRAGDRIGHGTALGIEIERWGKSTGSVILNKEQRFFDLVWEWGMYSSGEADTSAPSRISHLEHEIRKLGEEIFGESLDPYEAGRFTEALYLEKNLYIVGFPSSYRNPRFLRKLRHVDKRLWRIHQYLTSPAIFCRGAQTMEINPATEASSLMVLQNAMRKKIGKAGLVVEINPTSNLLIADLGDLEHHSFWRLYPPRGTNDATPPVNVAIGSDNPFTLATTIRDEYQFVLDTLILAGLSEAQAMRWLDHVREISLNSRFTLP